MAGAMCQFHTDEWSPGVHVGNGEFAHQCNRTTDHPQPGPWRWFSTPPPPQLAGLGGLAAEWNLDHELVEALRELGTGWFEYGLVERSYAARRPRDFAEMVDRWSHTAIAPTQYSATSYLGGVLGRMSSHGLVGYHDGDATGRWSYNTRISYWCLLPTEPWEQRTTWVDVIGDTTRVDREAGLACKSYVLGS